MLEVQQRNGTLVQKTSQLLYISENTDLGVNWQGVLCKWKETLKQMDSTQCKIAL